MCIFDYSRSIHKAEEPSLSGLVAEAPWHAMEFTSHDFSCGVLQDRPDCVKTQLMLPTLLSGSWMRPSSAMHSPSLSAPRTDTACSISQLRTSLTPWSSTLSRRTSRFWLTPRRPACRPSPHKSRSARKLLTLWCTASIHTHGYTPKFKFVRQTELSRHMVRSGK